MTLIYVRTHTRVLVCPNIQSIAQHHAVIFLKIIIKISKSSFKRFKGFILL